MKKTYLKIKHWLCKVGLCNLNKCGCDCHENASTPKTTVTKNLFKPHLEEATTGLANPTPHEESPRKVKRARRTRIIGEWERRRGITE